MQSGISPDNMQQVLKLGLKQSILNPAVLRLPKIGYCPMIEGFCSDLNTVYTVFKHAKIVSDVLRQHDAVITFDVAIFLHADKFK